MEGAVPRIWRESRCEGTVGWKLQKLIDLTPPVTVSGLAGGDSLNDLLRVRFERRHLGTVCVKNGWMLYGGRGWGEEIRSLLESTLPRMCREHGWRGRQ